MYQQYGDVAEYRLGKIRLIQLNHPDHVKHVLVDNAQNYVKPVVPDAGAILKPRGGLPVTLTPVSREAGAAAGSKAAAT